MKLFCDTGFFIAIYDPKDQYHQKAKNLVKTIETTNPILVISDYVYSETVSSLLRTHKYYGPLRAKEFDNDVFDNKIYSFTFIGESLFEKARKIFFDGNKGRKWSFVDCTSFALMEDYGIKEVLSFDENFREFGFSLIGQ